MTEIRTTLSQTQTEKPAADPEAHVETAANADGLTPRKELRIIENDPKFEKLRARMKEFMATPTGTQISDREDEIDDMVANLRDAVKQHNQPLSTEDPGSLKNKWNGYLLRNGLEDGFIDFKRLDFDRDTEYCEKAINALRELQVKLELLAYKLSGRPDLSIGKTVTLYRQATKDQPKPAPETDWYVYNVAASGLRVVKPKEGSGSFVGIPEAIIPYDRIDVLLPAEAELAVDDDGYVTVR
jgi:hypothetical protein